MSDEIDKYRLEHAQKLFDSLKGLKDLEKLWLPTLRLTLGKLEENLNKTCEAYGEAPPDVDYILSLIKDFKSEVSILISRALEGHMIIVTQIAELTVENKKLNELLGKDNKERKFLDDKIKKLEDLISKFVVEKPEEPPKEEEPQQEAEKQETVEKEREKKEDEIKQF